MKLKQIFKREVAMELKIMGNPIEDAVVNLKNNKFVVYMFMPTKKLEEDLKKITKK